MICMFLSVLVVIQPWRLALDSCNLITFLYFPFQDRFGHFACLGAILSRENLPTCISAPPSSPAAQHRILAEERWLNSDRVPAVDVFCRIVTDQEDHRGFESPLRVSVLLRDRFIRSLVTDWPAEDAALATQARTCQEAGRKRPAGVGGARP